MTSNAATKKAIRERMAATGEPYMEARRRIDSAPVAPTPSGAWIIHQRATSASDSTPYPWVLHEDGSTHGFIDHGHLIGVLADPDDRMSMRHLPRPLTQETVESMIGCYPVTVDRFTRQWATWTQPIAAVEQAAPAGQRAPLDGGHNQGGGSPTDQERAQRRADADRRFQKSLNASGPFVSDLFFQDGDSLPVEDGGTTREGLIVGFVSDESPRAVITWSEVEKALSEGSDLARLSGLRVSVQPNDMATPVLLGGVIDEVILDHE